MNDQSTNTNQRSLGRLAEMLRGIFKNRLLLALLAISLVPLIILGLSMYYLASNSIMQQATDRLAAVRTIKANQIQSYFHSIQDQIQTFSEDRMVVQAMSDFHRGMNAFQVDNEITEEKLADMRKKVETYYRSDFARKYVTENETMATDTQALIDKLVLSLDADTIALQYQYIQNNPNELGSKDLLDQASDGSEYSTSHKL